MKRMTIFTKDKLIKETIVQLNMNDKFLLLLPKELMLDELLCGECQPEQFLRESIKNVLLNIEEEKMKRRQNQRRDYLNDME